GSAPATQASGPYSPAPRARRARPVGETRMPTLKLRRIDCADPKSARQLADLRRQISHQGEVVSPKSRELTRKVFGEALPPGKAVEGICTDVQKEGLAAVLHYTEQFDKAKLTPGEIRVSAAELQAAHAAADPDFLDTIRNIRQNVLSFQMGLIHSDAILSVSG